MVSVGILSHVLKIDDAMIGVLSCTSKILASFVYAFATTTWAIYLGKFNRNVFFPFLFSYSYIYKSKIIF